MCKRLCVNSFLSLAFVGFAAICLGCSAQKSPSTTSPSPSPVPVASASASRSPEAAPQGVATPSGVPLLDPIMPTPSGDLVLLAPYTEADGETYEWWTQSGVSENRLRVMASALEPAELEARLQPFLSQDERTSLVAPNSALDVAGSRLALYASGMRNIGVLISPIGQPPAAWEVLGVPPLDWSSQQTLLADKKSLVVFASGYGMAEELRDRLSRATATPSNP